jgi:hypothetical protein
MTMRLLTVLVCAIQLWGGWRAGVGEEKITPPMGSAMAGFSARKGGAQGVHDDLHVRALVVESGGAGIALVTADLVGVGKQLTGEIRAEASRRTGIPAERILISATHTHSGPVVDAAYGRFFTGAAVAAIEQAWRSRQPALIGAGAATHRGWVGMNRRRLEAGFSPVDKQIPILKVCDASGKVLAVVFNYSCHPACLGPDSLLISADWPYFTGERIRAKLGSDVRVLFFQGTEGNVNTGYSAGLSAIGVPIPTRNLGYAQEVGEVLADAILARLPEIATEPDGVLGARRSEVKLEYYLPMSPADAEAALERARAEVKRLEAAGAPVVQVQAARVNQAFAGYARDRTARNLKAGGREYAAEIQAFRIGDAGFAGFPGEFFVEIGLEVKRRSPLATTFCLGLANESIGYVPVAEAYPEGGYEVSVARFGPGTAGRWIEAAAQLLHELR